MIIPHDVQAVPLWQVALVVGLVYVAHGLVKSYRARARSTPLGCPPRPSWLFGMSRLIMNNPDASSMYEAWVHQFGTVFKIPAPMGDTRVILTDPKAIAHFYSVETWTYVQTRLSRVAIENLVRALPSGDTGRLRVVNFNYNYAGSTQFGRGLLWAEGESHKRYVSFVRCV